MRFYGDDEICDEPCPPSKEDYEEEIVALSQDSLAWDAVLSEYREMDRELKMLLSMMTTDDFLEVRNASNERRS